MLTEDKLHGLMTELEADNIERTISVDNTDKLGQAICAFANDLPNRRRPGYLLIGVKDNGMLSGLRATDELLKNLGGIRSDGNVLPQPYMNIGKFPQPDGDVVVVEVYPSDLPPIRYKGRAYIRIGPRKGIANEQEERVLEERLEALWPDDEHPDTVYGAIRPVLRGIGDIARPEIDGVNAMNSKGN